MQKSSLFHLQPYQLQDLVKNLEKNLISKYSKFGTMDEINSNFSIEVVKSIV